MPHTPPPDETGSGQGATQAPSAPGEPGTPTRPADGHTEDPDHRARYAADVECAIGLNIGHGGTAGVQAARDAVLAVHDAAYTEVKRLGELWHARFENETSANNLLRQKLSDERAENARLRAAADRVRAVHYPVTETVYVGGEHRPMELCAHCNDDGNHFPWPCETEAALRGEDQP